MIKEGRREGGTDERLVLPAAVALSKLEPACFASMTHDSSVP